MTNQSSLDATLGEQPASDELVDNAVPSETPIGDQPPLPEERKEPPVPPQPPEGEPPPPRHPEDLPPEQQPPVGDPQPKTPPIGDPGNSGEVKF